MKITGRKCHTGTARSHKKLSCHVLIFLGGILATSLHVKVSIFFLEEKYITFTVLVGYLCKFWRDITLLLCE